MHDGPRYEDDFYAWTQHQAAVLRSPRVADTRFDREHDVRQNSVGQDQSIFEARGGNGSG